jgi:hypothetical protein
MAGKDSLTFFVSMIYCTYKYVKKCLVKKPISFAVPLLISPRLQCLYCMSLCLYVYACMSLCLYVYACMSLCLYVYACMSLCLYVPMLVFHNVCIPVCHYACMSLLASLFSEDTIKYFSQNMRNRRRENLA